MKKFSTERSELVTTPIIQIEPWIDEVEEDFLVDSIRTKYVTEHEYTSRFERQMENLTGAKYAVAMTNGTAALFCAFKALGLQPGDEVIVPNITFVATANAAIMAGLKPVLCEIERDYFCIDVEKASGLITERTKAIVPVHLYGQSANMDKVMAFAKKHNLFVVEDAAQGVGVMHKGQHVGTIGDIGILSFYGNKTITCGEGGVVITNNKELRDACYRLKNHGRDKKGIFIHQEIGFNFAFTEMQAAVGLAQMTKLNNVIIRKLMIHEKYVRELTGIPEFQFCKINHEVTTQPVYWFTSALAERRQELQEYLSERGIGSRLFFYPMHQQPCYAGMKREMGIQENDPGQFHYSEFVYSRGISLPSSYNLTDEQQDRVIGAVKAFYEGNK